MQYKHVDYLENWREHISTKYIALYLYVMYDDTLQNENMRGIW